MLLVSNQQQQVSVPAKLDRDHLQVAPQVLAISQVALIAGKNASVAAQNSTDNLLSRVIAEDLRWPSIGVPYASALLKRPSATDLR
jgi:hypothetical protein